MADFSTRIRELRKKSRLTQQEVADYLGVNKQTISGYERGVRRPDFTKLDALADMFDVSIAYLIGSQDERGEYPRHGEGHVIPDADKFIATYSPKELNALWEAYIDASDEIRKAVRRVLGMEK